MKPQFLIYDTLDDRREIYRLLHRLSPQKRIAFLNWCCKQATLGKHQSYIQVSRKSHQMAEQARKCDRADEALTADLYNDLWHLASHYQFDLDKALEELVRRNR